MKLCLQLCSYSGYGIPSAIIIMRTRIVVRFSVAKMTLEVTATYSHFPLISQGLKLNIKIYFSFSLISSLLYSFFYIFLRFPPTSVLSLDSFLYPFNY